MRLFVWKQVRNLSFDHVYGGVVVLARDIEEAMQMLLDHRPTVLATCDVFFRDPDITSRLEDLRLRDPTTSVPMVILFPGRAAIL